MARCIGQRITESIARPSALITPVVKPERLPMANTLWPTCDCLDVSIRIDEADQPGASIRYTAGSLSAATPTTCAFPLDWSANVTWGWSCILNHMKIGGDAAFGIPNKSRSRFLAVSGKGQCKENGLYSDGGDLTSVGDACLNSAPGPMPSSALIHDIIDFSAGQSSPGQKPYAERPLDHLTWRHQPRFATQSKRQ
jgi:hypothetical protein